MESSPCSFLSAPCCSLRLPLLSRVLLSSSLQVICTLVAAFLHFFFLSSFCWVLTEAWQSYMAVTGRLRNRIIRKRFLCLGWGEDPGAAEQRRARLQEGLVLLRRLARGCLELLWGF